MITGKKNTFISTYTASFIIGAVFLISAYTKLYPIEIFELTLVETGLVNWDTAPWLSRLLTGMEMALGTFLIFNVHLRKTVYYFVTALLGFFCLYLLLQIRETGNEGNCGCFGMALQMTPLEAIIKNIVLIIFTVFLIIFQKKREIKKPVKILSVFIILVSFALPFILNPISLTPRAAFSDDPSGQQLDLGLIYSAEGVTPPSVDLKEGKWVIGFFSATCPHCKIGAKKFSVLRKKDEGTPLYMVVNGTDENLKKFFEETGAGDIPYTELPGKHFIKLSGPNLPAIFLVEDGIIYKKTGYEGLEDYLEEWL